jgi:phosphatidate cytidylyltransferase
MSLRIITGLFLMLLCLLFFWLGGWPLWLLVLLAALICANELCRMLRNRGYYVEKYLVFAGILAFFLSATSLVNKYAEQIYTSLPAKIIFLGLISIYLLELFLKKPFLAKNKYLLSAKIALFFGGSFIFIFLVRDMPNGLFNLILAAILIWATDTFAFFGGKLFGKTPLTLISPKKTVEGSISALIACLIITLIIAIIFKLAIVHYLFLALLVSIFAQLGDLHESMIKRALNVKDSSQILPGHGGMYDRLDSTLFVAPLIFYFF